mgnify:CR=1 FL=1
MDNVPFTLTMFEFALAIWGLMATGLCFYINDKFSTFRHMTMTMVEHIADGNAKFVRNADGSVDVLIQKDN